MAAIEPISVGQGGSAYPTRPAFETRPSTGASLAGAAGPAGEAAGISGDGMGMANVLTAVSELLRDIGGGIENDRMLRMLVGLLILLALLDQQQGAQRSPELPQYGAGTGAAGSPVLLYQTASYTSISIEQTSVTTVAMGSPESLAAALGGNPDQGGRLDLAV